jgi:hypothetical protein
VQVTVMCKPLQCSMIVTTNRHGRVCTPNSFRESPGLKSRSVNLLHRLRLIVTVVSPSGGRVTQSVLQVLAGSSSFTSYYIIWGSAEIRRLLAEANDCQLEERIVHEDCPCHYGPTHRWFLRMSKYVVWAKKTN